MKITLKVLSAAVLALVSTASSAQLETVNDIGLIVAEVFESAGYDSSAENIREECNNPNVVNCAVITSVELAFFGAFRKHETLAQGFELLGEDDIAREYRRCESQDSTTGDAVRYGSYHCAEDAVLRPPEIIIWQSAEQVESGFQTLGYGRSAAEIRRACERNGSAVTCAGIMAVELLFFPVARHHPTVAGAYRTLGYSDLASEYERCDANDRNVDCSRLLAAHAQEIVNRQLNLASLDLTGDGLLTGADLASAAGSGARFAGPFAPSPAQAVATRWMNRLAAGPAIDPEQRDEMARVFDAALVALAATRTWPALTAPAPVAASGAVRGLLGR